MSLPESTIETQEGPAPVGPHRKPRPDLYTVLLVIAMVAILIGILFLYLEMRLYEFKLEGGPRLAMANLVSAISSQLSVLASTCCL